MKERLRIFLNPRILIREIDAWLLASSLGLKPYPQTFPSNLPLKHQNSLSPGLETDNAPKTSCDLMCLTFPFYLLTTFGKTAQILYPWSAT